MEGIHVCLAIGTILTIELLFTKCLRRSIGIALRRLGVEWSAVDLVDQILVVVDLSTFLFGEGGWLLQVWVWL